MTMYSVCCLCNADLTDPRAQKLKFFQRVSKFRIVLKECLLRRKEFPIEMINHIISMDEPIAVCQSHAPDYLEIDKRKVPEVVKKACDDDRPSKRTRATNKEMEERKRKREEGGEERNEKRTKKTEETIVNKIVEPHPSQSDSCFFCRDRNSANLLEECLRRKSDFPLAIREDLVSRGKDVLLCRKHTPVYNILTKTMKPRCCLCLGGFYNVPKLTVPADSDCRNLLKDCLLRKSEFPLETIDNFVERKEVIELCQSHAPDYEILGYELGYLQEVPEEKLSHKERQQFVAQSPWAQRVFKDRQAKAEEDSEKQETFERSQIVKSPVELVWKLDKKERQQKMKDIVEKVKTENLRRSTIFNASVFPVTGAELRSLIHTMLRFNCVCVTPKVKYGKTEKVLEGARVELTCEKCGTKTVWMGSAIVVPEEEKEEEDEYGNDMVDKEEPLGEADKESSSMVPLFCADDSKTPSADQLQLAKEEKPGK